MHGKKGVEDVAQCKCDESNRQAYISLGLSIRNES